MSRPHELAQKGRQRRLRPGVAIAAAVLATVGTVAAIESTDGRATEHDEPLAPPPAAGAPDPPRTEPAQSHSPDTWVDTRLEPRFSGHGWKVGDPLRPARHGWYDVIAANLDPAGELQKGRHGSLVWRLEPARGPKTWVDFGLLVDVDDGHALEHGCPVIVWSTEQAGRSGCRADRLVGPDGEDAWLIVPRNPEREDGCRGSPICEEQVALVVVERPDGTLGYVSAFGHGGPGANPFPLDVMAQAAADPRFTLPAEAFAVPRDPTVTDVAREHFESFQPDPDADLRTLGFGFTRGVVRDKAWGPKTSRIDDRLLAMAVRPAGRSPQCGRQGLGSCVARQVYGGGDPTTVYVGRWCDEWCYVQLVHVGSRNTVAVWAGYRLGRHPHQQERLIDLVLDHRLQ